MTKSRIESSVKNFKYSILFSVLIIFLQFFNRMIFTRYLSVQYLGLNGLFSNIISILNLADLGISTAIIYALYEPYAENNTEKIKSIMFLFKKLYNLIAFTVLSIGILMIPFLNNFINKDSRGISNIKIFFFIYVLDTFFSYILAYKRSIVIVNQDVWVLNLTCFLRNMLTSICQIIALIYFGDYLIYLVIKAVFTLGENIFINYIVDRKFPFLREKAAYPGKDVTQDIRKNLFAMSLHKIGTVFVFATDNIIISRFVSLTAAGLYSNYSVVVSGISSIINKFFSSISASVGNLIVEYKEYDREYIYRIFKRILFINFVLFFLGSVGIYFCSSSFVSLWLGDKFRLDEITVLFISIYVFSTGIRFTINTFRNADGLFYKDRYKPVAEGIFNIIISIPLTMRFGLKGTLIGTIITNVLIAGSIEGYIVHKYLFEKSFWLYIRSICKYYSILILTLLFGKQLMNKVQISSFWNFIIEVIFSVIIVAIIIVLLFRKTDEYIYLKKLLKKRILRRKE